jgi:hypothetical protein
VKELPEAMKVKEKEEREKETGKPGTIIVPWLMAANFLKGPEDDHDVQAAGRFVVEVTCSLHVTVSFSFLSFLYFQGCYIFGFNNSAG